MQIDLNAIFTQLILIDSYISGIGAGLDIDDHLHFGIGEVRDAIRYIIGYIETPENYSESVKYYNELYKKLSNYTNSTTQIKPAAKSEKK